MNPSEYPFLTGQPLAMSHPNRGAEILQFFNRGAFVSATCKFKSEANNPQVIEQENCTSDGLKYNLLGQYGQAGRSILSGPAFSDTDFSVMRDFTITERYKL